MAKSEGLALMPWSPLAGGFLTGKYTRETSKAGGSRRDEFDFPPINKEKAYDIIDKMLPIARNHNVSVAQVALAWLLAKPAVTSVIIGAKKQDQLIDNLAAADLKLSDEEMNELNEISALEMEYPAWMLERQGLGRMPNNG